VVVRCVTCLQNKKEHGRGRNDTEDTGFFWENGGESLNMCMHVFVYG